MRRHRPRRTPAAQEVPEGAEGQEILSPADARLHAGSASPAASTRGHVYATQFWATPSFGTKVDVALGHGMRDGRVGRRVDLAVVERRELSKELFEKRPCRIRTHPTFPSAAAPPTPWPVSATACAPHRRLPTPPSHRLVTRARAHPPGPGRLLRQWYAACPSRLASSFRQADRT